MSSRGRFRIIVSLFGVLAVQGAPLTPLLHELVHAQAAANHAPAASVAHATDAADTVGSIEPAEPDHAVLHCDVSTCSPGSIAGVFSLPPTVAIAIQVDAQGEARPRAASLRRPPSRATPAAHPRAPPA